MEEQNNIGNQYYCPICHEPLTGNEKIKYYCKKCNLLFSKETILNEQEIRKLRENKN